ncbi:DMT family transporter [Mycoavidus cysteinexigens]|nr:DMT family transporter [Mycoavidus cysteinexigens]GAM52014.1 permease of the drug/metabolite transporter (DMT) superfamily [bacterium endosymbiont of Mortierella elongata FMR23-6]
MNGKSFFLLFVLAALWGGSFLFICIGVSAFGPAPLMAVRVVIAAGFLLAALIYQHGISGLRNLYIYFGPLCVVGMLNAALPFVLFAYAELTIAAGLTSVIMATAPLWGALVGRLWFKEHLGLSRTLGLLIGFAGVLLLVWHQVSVSVDRLEEAPDPSPILLAILASLVASLMYGISANYTSRYLSQLNPMQIAAGTMLSSAVLLIPFAIVQWPSAPVPWQAWAVVAALGIACTAVAFIVYFHLIATTEPAYAISVMFLVPIFGVLWGVLFLQEEVSLDMLASGSVILIGVLLSTGLLNRLYAKWKNLLRI